MPPYAVSFSNRWLSIGRKRRRRHENAPPTLGTNTKYVASMLSTKYVASVLESKFSSESR